MYSTWRDTHTFYFTVLLSAETPQEKERFLSSVISALDKKDELKKSYAMAHAHALRAKLFIKNKDYPAATRDAEFAVKLDSTNDLAWRSLADAHEASGNFEDAIKVLQRWSKARPAFSTKANKEIQRLRELMWLSSNSHFSRLPFCDLFFNSNDAQVFDDLWLKGKDAFAFKLCIHESKLNHECQIKVRANRLPAHFVMPQWGWCLQRRITMRHSILSKIVIVVSIAPSKANDQG